VPFRGENGFCCDKRQFALSIKEGAFMSTPNPYAPPLAELDAQPLGGPTAILASRASRLGAWLLDTLLYAAIAVVPALVIGLTLYAARKASGVTPDAARGDGIRPAVMIGAAVACLPLFALLIYQAYRVSTTGQTLGKKWLAIRIVKIDDAPVNFVSGVLLRGILPWFLGIIPYLGFIFTLTDILFIFGEERRCLHDLLASTKVVTA
jgi:uncharacterized RDD family membrane protein YckC